MSNKKFKIKVFNVDSNKRLDKINKSIEPKFLPKLNQHMMICAPTNSGKSTIVANLLLGPLKFKWDRVIFFSGTWDYDLYKKVIQIDDEHVHTEYTDEKLMEIVEENKRLEEEKEKPIFTLLIFDDLQHEFSRGSYLEKFLTMCRHWNITCWVMAQYIHGISKQARQQFSSIICFPSLSNEEDLDLISEVSPISKKKFKEACKIINDKIKNDKLNIRTFLFINKNSPDKFYLNFEEPIF
jgi:hypothetical protein